MRPPLIVWLATMEKYSPTQGNRALGSFPMPREG